MWTVLSEVYGVQLPASYTGWLAAFGWLNVGQDIILPPACIGSAENVLLLGALWPLVAIGVVQFGLVVATYSVAFWRYGCRPYTMRRAKPLLNSVLRGIPVVILITFCVLPRTARSIFQTWACESFVLDDESGAKRSYMREYWSVECGEAEHTELVATSWGLLILWPVCIPLMYCAMLWSCRKPIQSRRPTFLSSSIGFLHREYKEQCAPDSLRTHASLT